MTRVARDSGRPRPLSKTQKRNLSAFARTLGLRIHPYFWDEFECERGNMRVISERLKNTNRQRRETVRELERLADAVEDLSEDARSNLKFFLPDEKMVMEDGIEIVEYGPRDVDVTPIARAARRAAAHLKSLRVRGRNAEAEIRRAFVRKAVRLFVLAGGRSISAKDGTPFMKWINYAMPLLVDDSEFVSNGSMRRLVLEEFGRIKAERDSRISSIIASEKRRNPWAFEGHKK